MKRNIILTLILIIFYVIGILHANHFTPGTVLSIIISIAIGILAAVVACVYNHIREHRHKQPYINPLNHVFMESLKKLKESTETLKELQQK